METKSPYYKVEQNEANKIFSHSIMGSTKKIKGLEEDTWLLVMKKHKEKEKNGQNVHFS